MPQHFLTLLDFPSEELRRLVARGSEFRRLHQQGQVHQPLKGKVLLMIFEAASSRTRVAFESGMSALGGHAINMAPAHSQLGRGEPLEDTARALSGMVDAVTIRTLDHVRLEKFAVSASVPVINAMTDRSHPCQLLADMQAFVELRGDIAGRRVAFIGDGYNMCLSYIEASERFEFDLTIATPAGMEPEIPCWARRAEVCQSPQRAVEGADLVVTDVWSSIGHEDEREARTARFEGFQVTAELLDRANKDVLFMHCLPAHHGEEIATGLFDDPRSVVWHEAHNRRYAQQALLEKLLLAPVERETGAGVR